MPKQNTFNEQYTKNHGNWISGSMEIKIIKSWYAKASSTKATKHASTSNDHKTVKTHDN